MKYNLLKNEYKIMRLSVYTLVKVVRFDKANVVIVTVDCDDIHIIKWE